MFHCHFKHMVVKLKVLPKHTQQARAFKQACTWHTYSMYIRCFYKYSLYKTLAWNFQNFYPASGQRLTSRWDRSQILWTGPVPDWTGLRPWSSFCPVFKIFDWQKGKKFAYVYTIWFTKHRILYKNPFIMVTRGSQFF